MPKCIGFILDGNRRYAEKNKLPKVSGHKKGLDTLQIIIKEVSKRKVPHMVCYVFSTENWNRDKKEVDYLLELFNTGIDRCVEELEKDNLRAKIAFRFVGQLDKFSSVMQEKIVKIEEDNPAEPALTVWLLLSYGGRAEIIAGINKALEHGEKVTEEGFKDFLWTKEMPDPDLIIRTGGEQRLSNFLTWQSVYSELIFTSTFWPDFNADELDKCLTEYNSRCRRHGK